MAQGWLATAADALQPPLLTSDWSLFAPVTCRCSQLVQHMCVTCLIHVCTLLLLQSV